MKNLKIMKECWTWTFCLYESGILICFMINVLFEDDGNSVAHTDDQVDNSDQDTEVGVFLNHIF